MAAPPSILTATLSPALAELIATDRRKAHVHILSAFPRGLGKSPRAQAGLLWHLHRNQLTIQYALPPETPGLLGDASDLQDVHMPQTGELINMAISLNCQKTPMSNVPEQLRSAIKNTPKPSGGRTYRSRMIIVPEKERTAWAARKLADAGLEPVEDTITVSALDSISLDGKRRTIPYVEITATARVIDADELNKKIREGMGKGKNYGLGMLRISSTTIS